jgi:hypothetical protein
MIRKQTSFLVAAIASMGFAASAQAQQGAAQVTQFEKSNAGTFIVFGPTAICADGSVGTVNGFGFISASDSTSHQPGGPPTSGSGAFIEILDYFDSCTGTFIGDGFAGLSGGYQGPNPALKSASLSGSTFVQDFDTFASFPMSLNLVFTGEGPVTAEKGTTVTHDAGSFKVIVFRQSSASRAAGVTGTITINGVEPDASFSSTSLAINSTGTVAVQQQ